MTCRHWSPTRRRTRRSRRHPRSSSGPPRTAGTCAQPPNVEGHDAYEQAVAALWIIRKALHETGATIDDVVRTRLFVVNMDDADKGLRAHGEVFGDVRPAATLLGVNALINPDLLVEIEVDAVIDA